MYSMQQLVLLVAEREREGKRRNGPNLESDDKKKRPQPYCGSGHIQGNSEKQRDS